MVGEKLSLSLEKPFMCKAKGWKWTEILLTVPKI